MNDNKTDFSQHWVNLGSARLGAAAVACSDDFFAPMHRMLKDRPPVWKEGKYDDNGKWMDGWESRRKRGPGNDWCIVRLARPGVIHGIEIQTTHFTGNYAPAASVEACYHESGEPGDNDQWVEILARHDLQGDSEHAFGISHTGVFTHVRLTIYPDGGIARLRVYAEPKVDWAAIGENELVDLAAALNGGVALTCNDQHFGDIRNLLAPGRGLNMGDGWETRRRREPGYDWVIIALAHPGRIHQIEIDTAHFKGNYPDRCEIRGAMVRAATVASLPRRSEDWQVLLPASKLEADQVHHFEKSVTDIGAISHVRVNIFPDGGISRLRLFGTVDTI
ncbi:MAG: allantoicase [Gammaproteobacteria bacterium]|nr:allantoicase [Gammaproteobacteria bacterium]